MKCPFCGYEESKVIDSRPTDENERIRRRRECMNCAKRFTTYEKIGDLSLRVEKKSGFVELYSREKVFNGIMRALTEIVIHRLCGICQNKSQGNSRISADRTKYIRCNSFHISA